MARTIGQNANVNRIVDHVLRTQRAGLAEGGEIGKTIDGRLAPAIANLKEKEAEAKTATENAATVRAAFMTADDRSKKGIRTFKDTVFNLLGRPRSSPQLNQLFPGGVEQYLSPRPEQQPMVMKVLLARIEGIEASWLPEAVKKESIEKLEALRVAQEAAYAAYRPLEGAEMVAVSEHEAAIGAAQQALVVLKRDLKTLGLSETQIAHYIPDASPAPTPKKPDQGGGGSTPPTTSNGSATA